MSNRAWIAAVLIILVGVSGYWYLDQQPVVDIKDLSLGSKTILEGQSGTLSFRVESGWNLPSGGHTVEIRIEAPTILSFYVAGVGKLREDSDVWFLPLGKLIKPFNMPVALMVKAGRLPSMTSSVTNSISVEVYIGGQFRNVKTISLTVEKGTTAK